MSAPELPRSFELLDVTHRFLIEASDTLATPEDPTAILERLAELVAPRVADFCAVHIRGDEGAELLRVVHCDASQVERLTEAGARYPIRSSPKSSVQRVFDTGEPILLGEIDAAALRERAQDEEHLRILQSLGARSAMIVPAHGRERVVATLTFVSSDPTRRYGTDDLTALSDLARLAALAMENARLAKSERRARRDAEAAVERASRLQKLTSALATAVTPEDATTAMARECCGAVGGSMGFVWLLRSGGKTLSLVSHAGSERDVLESFAELPLDSDLPVLKAFHGGEPIFLHSPEDRAERFPNSLFDRDTGTRAWAVVPIWAGQRPLGGMVVSCRHRPPKRSRSWSVKRGTWCGWSTTSSICRVSHVASSSCSAKTSISPTSSGKPRRWSAR